jgi:hypothetical protein
MRIMISYDEGLILERVAILGRKERTAFAALCAQRLFSLVERYSDETTHVNAEALGAALDAVWAVLEGNDVNLRPFQAIAEEMVPSDSGSWVFEMGYGQNAAACVAYAARAWLTNDPRESVWASRQVYEAADYAAQRLIPDPDLNSPEGGIRLMEHQVVQMALQGIFDDLIAVESASSDWRQLRMYARDGAMSWIRSMP